MIAQPSDGRKVALVLMKSDEATATIDALEDKGVPVEVVDCTPCWQLEADNEIRVDMVDVSAELGRKVSLGQWLAVMSSFVGRARPGADYFLVTSHLDGLEADWPRAPGSSPPAVGRGVSYTVRLEPRGSEFSVGDDETILVAAERQGQRLTYGCRHGRCSSCKYQSSSSSWPVGRSPAAWLPTWPARP